MKKFLLFAALLSIVVLVGLHYYLEYKKTIPEVSVDIMQDEKQPVTPQEPEEPKTHRAPAKSRERRAETHDDIRWQSTEGIVTGRIDELTETPTESTSPTPEETEEPIEERVYAVSDVMPRFPDGEAALLKYIDNHLQQPSSVQNGSILGVVVLRFVVKADGSIGKIVVLKGLSPDCDNAAIKAVRSLPRFIPGKNKGKPVNVWFTCPIRFAAY